MSKDSPKIDDETVNTTVEEINPKPRKTPTFRKPTPEPPKADLESKPEPSPEKKPTAPTINLRRFVTVSGKRPDQLAGFVSYAKAAFKDKNFSVLEWHEEFNKFMTRPTGLGR